MSKLRHDLPFVPLLLAFVLPLATACGAGDAAEGDRAMTEPERPAVANPAPTPVPASATGSATTADQATAPAGRPLAIFLGDSLSAGLGVDEDQAFPALVARQLAAEGHPFRLVNAGVSGDTTAGGLRRLDWLLRQRPAVLVVELGANDGLRGLPLDETEANLREIVARARDAGAKVLLLGMKLPPNYGDYAARFTALYPRIAQDTGVALVPFLLEGVGGDPTLNQGDGMHPNVAGHEIVARTVAPFVRDLLPAK